MFLFSWNIFIMDFAETPTIDTAVRNAFQLLLSQKTLTTEILHALSRTVLLTVNSPELQVGVKRFSNFCLLDSLSKLGNQFKIRDVFHHAFCSEPWSASRSRRSATTKKECFHRQNRKAQGSACAPHRFELG